MRRIVPFVLVSTVLAACGSGSRIQIPPEAQAIRAYIETEAASFGRALRSLLASLPLVLDPVAAAAAGITFEDDPNSVDPNGLIYTFPLDSDGDGLVDTTITGSVLLNADPSQGDVPGFGGMTDFHIDLPDGVMFDGMFDFLLGMDGVAVWGDGTFDNPAEDSTTDVTIDPEHPVVITDPTVTPGTTANVCNYSFDGIVGMLLSRPGALFSVLMNFSALSNVIRLTQQTYTDADDMAHDLPDSNLHADMCDGSIEDWVGVFVLEWFCDEEESGTSRITITISSSNTIRIVDEDIPSSGMPIVFTAMLDPVNPHVVRGTFTDSDGGGTYEEDVTWTLSPDGNTITQESVYEYIDSGFGGVCGGSATREGAD